MAGTEHEGCNEECGDGTIPALRRIPRDCREPGRGAGAEVEGSHHEHVEEVHIPKIRNHEGADEEEVHRNDHSGHASPEDAQPEGDERRSGWIRSEILMENPQPVKFHAPPVLLQRLLLRFELLGICLLQHLLADVHYPLEVIPPWIHCSWSPSGELRRFPALALR